MLPIKRFQMKKIALLSFLFLTLTSGYSQELNIPVFIFLNFFKNRNGMSLLRPIFIFMSEYSCLTVKIKAVPQLLLLVLLLV